MFIPQKSENMNLDEIEKQVLVLAREGFVLPQCPECGMLLDLETEALFGKCKTCEVEFTIRDVLWIAAESFPEA